VGYGRGREWERALGKEWAFRPDREREDFFFKAIFKSFSNTNLNPFEFELKTLREKIQMH